MRGVANSQTDPTQVWPGSQAIAKAKAYTANAFSLDSLALSTALLGNQGTLGDAVERSLAEFPAHVRALAFTALAYGPAELMVE